MEVEIIFFKTKEGNVNFRIEGQRLPKEVEVLKKKEIPGWGLEKANFYCFLKDQYGTTISFDSRGIRRCAFISAFDDTEDDLIGAAMGTIYWGEKESPPSEKFLKDEAEKDLVEFRSSSYKNKNSFLIYEDREEWRRLSED